MTFIEIEDLDLMNLKFRWDLGDKFAFIEAITYCAAQDREYPKWVRAQIDDAMTTIFNSVFPNIDFKKEQASFTYSDAIIGDGQNFEKIAKDRFNKAASKAIKILCLKSDNTNIVSVRNRAVRNISLAELVAEYVEFQPKPDPTYKGATTVIRELAQAFDLSPKEWKERRDNAAAFTINGHMLPISYVPPECRGASIDVIRKAWEEHKDTLLDLKIKDFEERNGITL